MTKNKELTKSRVNLNNRKKLFFFPGNKEQDVEDGRRVGRRRRMKRREYEG